MTYRVIQWATGGVGRAAIEHLVLHPDLTLVGCWVHGPEKAGLDAGEIAGIGPLGVPATNDQDEILRSDADCVLYAPLVPNPAEVAALLRSGKNVVTPVGWFWPGPKERAAMEAAAVEGGVSLHGTGIDPGGVTEQHPLFFAGLSSAVTFVRGEEFSDVRTYGAPDVVRYFMGFGGPPEEARAGSLLRRLSGGFTQSVQMCLDALGFADAEIRPSHEIAVATAPIEGPAGTIRPGEVAAQRFAWEAFVGERKVVRVAVNWFMGDEHLDPPWTFGPAGERYEVEVQGDPGCTVVINGWTPSTVADAGRNPGVVATAAHCVNSIPAVCAAPPGVVTFVDLSLVTGRAHPDLAR
ncbi:dihydrodipicolinate reductase [Cryptosporangium phraense]|uniref:Dihydrodipicolinate reductase n=1 Tax=Cryptosporangium phraense TaxID=2593070 RepID=A0A545AGD6_9ACTN|nr:dihydrodipicolinate reductase [Cryptosporangium phraense]TQS40374.1 dihydrodipicolinate reductase [Cryptosporangium phraense]